MGKTNFFSTDEDHPDRACVHSLRVHHPSVSHKYHFRIQKPPFCVHEHTLSIQGASSTRTVHTNIFCISVHRRITLSAYIYLFVHKTKPPSLRIKPLFPSTYRHPLPLQKTPIFCVNKHPFLFLSSSSFILFLHEHLFFLAE